MRVLSETPDRLTLEERPWLVGITLMVVIVLLLLMALALGRHNLWVAAGLVFGAAVFGVAFVAFVRRVIVIFDRAAGAVVIRSVSVLGQQEQTIGLADIAGVEVESQQSMSSSDNRHSSRMMTHRAVLRTNAAILPLTEVYTSGSGAQKAADAVRRWLDR